MNEYEEAAFLAVAASATAADRSQALRWAHESRRVRLSTTGQAKLVEIRQRADVAARDPEQKELRFVAHPLNDIRALDPGPEPFLAAPVMEAIRFWVECWLHEAALRTYGADPPGAMLLCGPPGTGKTTTAAWLASLWGDTRVVEVHDLVSKYMGESSQQIAKLFARVREHRSLLVLEELDGLGTTRSGGSDGCEVEDSRITIALMRCIEHAKHPVVCTTNRKTDLDAALLRRFDEIVELPEPTPENKVKILTRALGQDSAEIDPMFLKMPIVDAIRIFRRVRRSAAMVQIEQENQTS